MSTQPVPQPDPIIQMVRDPDFGKMAVSEQRKALAAHDSIFQNAGDDAIGQFVQAQQSPAAGPDDPNGNYDFGDLGKVQGVKLNGKPATRQQAFNMLSNQQGFAQTMGNNLQRNRQDISNFISSNVDTDQATKGYLGDLAGMLAAGGNPEAARAARWASGASSGAASALRANAPTFAKKFILGNTIGRAADISPIKLPLPDALERPTGKDIVNLFRQGAPDLEAQTDPTFFRQFGQQQHLPVTGPPPGPQAGAPPILTPIDAALQRERGTAAQQLPFLVPKAQSSAPAPAQVQQQSVAASSPAPQATSPRFVPATIAGDPVNEVMMRVDPAKLDAAIPRDNYYVGPGGIGYGAMPGRYARFQQFMQENPNTPIEAPRVSMDENGKIDFTNGRHRFAVLRDQGLPEVQISVPPKQVGMFEQNLGAVRADLEGQTNIPPPGAQPQAPASMEGYYGKHAGKSNLKGNQRQLASPTAAASQNPGNQGPGGPHPPDIMRILNTPGKPSNADMDKLQSYLAKQRFNNMLRSGPGK